MNQSEIAQLRLKCLELAKSISPNGIEADELIKIAAKFLEFTTAP